MHNGDDRTTAEAVTRKPGLDRVDAEVLPEKTSIGWYCIAPNVARRHHFGVSGYTAALFYHWAGGCVQPPDCGSNPRALSHLQTWKLTHE